MGLLDFFRQKEEQPLVFSGDNLEADLVIGLLKSAGFHPYELSNIPRAALGAFGSGRVMVPPEELEEARALPGRSDEERGRGQPGLGRGRAGGPGR